MSSTHSRRMKHDDVHDDPRELQAVDWLLRLSAEQVCAQDIEEWRQWLAASTLNQIAFERVQTVWNAASCVTEPRWPTDLEVAADRYDASTEIPRPANPPPKTRRSRWFLAAAALAAMMVGTVLIWSLDSGTSVLTTGIGESRSFSLGDGSQITLRGASRVRVVFSEQRRALELESGEALFDVAKDPRRPFDVRAGNANVVAIGTEFSVRRVADRVAVVVISGVVRVSPTAPELAAETQAIRLDAGMETVVQAGQSPLLVHTTSASVQARRAGRLRYSDEPLRYVIADLNRYSQTPIEIADARAGDLLISGTVLEEDVPGWLRGLEQALPVAVTFEQDRISIR